MKNLLISGGFLLSLAVYANCYEFQDSYYNQVLAADIQDLENSTQYEDESEELHSRKRRAVTAGVTTPAPPAKEDCKPISYSPCCDVTMSPPLPIEQEIRKTCYKEVFLKKDETKSNTSTVYDPFNCEKIMKMRNDILCMSQCIAQKLKMADAKGSLILEGMAKYIGGKLNGTWVAPLVKTISAKCEKQVSAITLSYLNKKTLTTCNPAFSQLSFCLYKEIQINCPAKEIKNPRRCDMFRAFVKNNTNSNGW